MTSPQAVTGDQASAPPITWRKSSYSGDTGNCVEVAALPSTQIGIRDSKNPAGPMLQVSPAEWRSFTEKVRINSLTSAPLQWQYTRRIEAESRTADQFTAQDR